MALPLASYGVFMRYGVTVTGPYRHANLLSYKMKGSLEAGLRNGIPFILPTSRNFHHRVFQNNNGVGTLTLHIQVMQRITQNHLKMFKIVSSTH